ncbi:MAG TPA: DALR domain-containing protein, partial [Anaerovoracaceae bacterium]|nr:DALR domain-containing protein [Anaerovoracaceae bacterium]
LITATSLLDKLKPAELSSIDVVGLKEKCYTAMNDDMNTPILIAHLFDGVKMINSINDGNASVNNVDLEILKKLYSDFVFDILGFKSDALSGESADHEVLGDVVDLLINLRIEAKQNKDWATSDKIRNSLSQLGFEIKDTKEGSEWALKK